MKERFAFMPPTKTRPWVVTLRAEDGSYRTPELAELEALREAFETAVEREAHRHMLVEEMERALGLLRAVATEHNDEEIAEFVVRLTAMIR